MEPLPTKAIWVPKTFPRSLAGKTAVRMARPLAIIMAAPTADDILNAMRNQRFGEEPARIDDRPKRTKPAAYTSLRPN